ncbi:MAG: hypothetical protein Q8936_25325, partial [Bacillota bacterium]|nr:hypothetical protein [Bacillota bacterium]
MDINSLKDTLAGSVDAGNFVLDTSKLNSTAIDNISKQFFPDNKLNLTVDTPENSIQTSSTGDSVTVKGKGVDYPFNDMDVTAVFSLAGNDVVLVM